MLGHTVVDKLFQTTDPVGQSVRIKNIPFRVIGVLQRKGANMVGEDQDSIILMPVTTVRKRVQGSEFDNVNAILASARSAPLMAEASSEINELLAERHRVHFGKTRNCTVENTHRDRQHLRRRHRAHDRDAGLRSPAFRWWWGASAS